MFFYFYFYNVILVNLIYKFNIKVNEIPFFKKIVLTIFLSDISNLQDPVLMKSLMFLEYLTGQRPQIYKVVKKSKLVNNMYICKVTLRSLNLYNFLTFFYIQIISILIKNNILIKVTCTSKGHIIFSIKNLLTLLPINSFYLFNFNISLNFFFEIINSDRNKSFYLLELLNFPIKKMN